MFEHEHVVLSKDDNVVTTETKLKELVGYFGKERTIDYILDNAGIGNTLRRHTTDSERLGICDANRADYDNKCMHIIACNISYVYALMVTLKKAGL